MSSVVKKIVILGHSGFIGAHLERLLSISGDWEVIGRSLPDIDLSNLDGASQLLPFLTPECTVVLAAAVKRQFGDTLDAFQRNMVIVENVCRLLITNPVKKIIFMSSTAVYGEETENCCISEQTLVNPTSYYGIYKYAAERLLKKVITESKRSSLVCLRPPLVYGPGDPARTYGPSGFFAAALEAKPITLWGDGTELREFVYIEDLCRLIEFLADADAEGELNVVSGTRYCFADIVTALRSSFSNLEINMQPRSKQKANNAFDASKVKFVLPENFQFTSLEQGLTRMLEQSRP